MSDKDKLELANDPNFYDACMATYDAKGTDRVNYGNLLQTIGDRYSLIDELEKKGFEIRKIGLPTELIEISSCRNCVFLELDYLTEDWTRPVYSCGRGCFGATEKRPDRGYIHPICPLHTKEFLIIKDKDI